MTRAEQVIENLLKNPRLIWNEKIVMPSDKESKDEKRNQAKREGKPRPSGVDK